MSLIQYTNKPLIFFCFFLFFFFFSGCTSQTDDSKSERNTTCLGGKRTCSIWPTLNQMSPSPCDGCLERYQGTAPRTWLGLKIWTSTSLATLLSTIGALTGLAKIGTASFDFIDILKQGKDAMQSWLNDFQRLWRMIWIVLILVWASYPSLDADHLEH